VEIERTDYRRGFGRERIEGRTASGEVVVVPLSFTDAAPEEDPFLALSGGRALFRGDDLLRLVDLVRELGA
jgi:hypothetical protein